ncbi:MAG TPA: PAS domain-containing protein [Microlunatus sp.]|nr:PAS domain-containing protein [Microlunatus sp.]
MASPLEAQVISSSLVSAIAESTWFRVGWAPFVLMDVDLRVREVGPSFERVVGYPRTAVLDQLLFDVFPDNPADPTGAQSSLTASLEGVLRTGRRHWMGLQRYDVSDVAHPGQFIYKAWIPVNVPITDAGRVVGVLNHSQDVTLAVTRGSADLAASYAPDQMAAAADTLLREFPDAEANIVLSILVHSQQQVLEAIGMPDIASATQLARLRLEIRTGHPGIGSED